MHIRAVFCAAAVWLVAFLDPMAACAELPATFKLDEMKDDALENWSAADKEEGHAFRSAAKGKTAVIRLPNWWNGSTRPPTGSLYVIELTYKDVADTPIVAEAFGGIAAHTSRSELHRFGGAHDGQWKVANVPASWDLLMLREGSTSAELALVAPVDLPVSQIVIRPAKLPDDQVRYEAECREWVAKVQSGKAAAAKQPVPDETPAVPDDMKAQALIPYARSCYDALHANSAPKKDEAGAAVNIRMARNEFEPGTFGVYAQEDLDDVTFSVSELSGPAGKLACEIRCQTVEFALEQVKGGSFVWSPQRIWPVYPAPIKKGQSGSFRVTIKTLGDTSLPGKYEGKINIRTSKHAASLPLKVEVLPITLLDMEQSKLRMGGCVTGYVSAGEMDAMKEHNHNMVNLWFTGVQPGMKMNGDKLELNFYDLDDWMRLAKERGINTIVYFLGGNPNGFPNTLSVERDLWAKALGKPRDDFFEKMGAEDQRGKILPEIQPVYKQLIAGLLDHAKEKNWPELIFTPFDEPAKWAYTTPQPEKTKFAVGCGPWIRDHFKAACALIHEAHPAAKIYISLHHNNERKVHGYSGRIGEVFFPDIDVLCTNAIDEDHELGNKVRALGKEFWQYGGSSSRRFGYGFYFGNWDSRGTLCWAYNWGSRFDLTSGSNWEYATYSPFTTILTPEYEEIREGWDDRRYIETARSAAKTAGKDVAPLLEQIFKEVLADRGQGGRDTVNDFWEEGRNACKMDQWRKMLADKIVELTKP